MLTEWLNIWYFFFTHCDYNDVIMSAMAYQITNLTIVYSSVYAGANQRKRQSSALLAFVRGILRWPVNSPQRASNAEYVSIWWRHHVLTRMWYKSPKKFYQYEFFQLRFLLVLSSQLQFTAVITFNCLDTPCLHSHLILMVVNIENSATVGHP